CEEEEAAKAERLAPYVAAALERRAPPRQAPADYVISVTGEPAAAPTWRQGGAGGPQTVAEMARHAGQVAAAAAMRRAGPRLLERTLGSNAGLRAAFSAMARRFNPESALGWTGDIQYLVGTSNGTREWYLHVGSEAATAVRGRCADPELTIRLPFELFLAIGQGEASVGKLMLDNAGGLEVDGDLRLIGRMGEMFVPPGTY
ncbi:MAG: SCP2 sterol-binding domain-containing protein, partial [Acidimicrobiales bacterium]